MVTYSVPFWNGSALGGIVTLDLEFSPSLRAAFASKDSFEDVHRCWSCQLPCTHSYRTVVHHVGHEKLCNRCVESAWLVLCNFGGTLWLARSCFVNGLLPANTKLDDLVHKMSGLSVSFVHSIGPIRL